MKRSIGTALALATACWAGAANANLISNGDFETRTFSSWTVSGDIVLFLAPPGFYPYFGAGSPAQDGMAMAVFNGGESAPNGTISQSFATVAGQTYLVKFDYGVTDSGTRTQTLNATVTGAGPTLATFSASGDHTPPAALLTFSFEFTADSSMSTLKFSDYTGNDTFSLDGVLDNISVTEKVSVPEPGALALLGVGLAGFGVARRRRPRS